MSGFLMRGALIEYGSDFMGPIPNVVIFQFNPETLTRTVQIPSRPTSGTARESTQAGDTSGASAVVYKSTAYLWSASVTFRRARK